MSQKMPHWLSKQASLSPNDIAIEWAHGETMTFIDLKRKSERFAQKMAHIGIKEGDHVGILSDNESNMIIAIHGLTYLGAVAVLLNTRLTSREISYQLKDAQAKYLLTSDRLKDKGNHLDLNIKIFAFTEIEQMPARAIPLKQHIDLEQPLTIMYTSGTTGQPKGVVHTYGNHWWSAIGSSLNIGIHKTDKWLIPLPLFHVSGFSTLMKSVIYGMPIYLLEKFTEDAVHNAIFNRNVTIVSVVTVMLQRLLAHLQDRKYPEAFRCMLLGGGSAPISLLNQAVKHNIPVFQSYGMTETSSQFATLSPKDALKKIGSAGKPLFPGELMIHHKNAQGIGEIIVKGPMVTKGYYNNKKATEETIQNGWLHTGDLGYIDQEGFLYVVDRRKDLIISGGENVYPSEIEHVLSEMPQIKEVAVTGQEDQTWGKVPVAFVVLNDPDCTTASILQFARDRLASYKIPKEIHFVKELPRNASNKIMRHKLFTLIDD